MPGDRKRYIAYLRVSKEEQTRGISYEVQEAKVRAQVELLDGNIVALERDDLSGKDRKRPGLDRALERVKSQEADALIVYSLDRLARRTLDFLCIVGELAEAGKDFICVREQLDTTTPHGRMVATILAAMAEMERELIRSRCRDASAQLQRERRAWGRTPYGYDRHDETDPNDPKRVRKHLVENPTEIAVLREMVERRGERATLQEIADDLNSRKIRAKDGGVWRPSNVRGVIQTFTKLRRAS